MAREPSTYFADIYSFDSIFIFSLSVDGVETEVEKG
jgi:hypothetical protein